MDPNQLAAMQSMIQSLATQVGSFTNSVTNLGGKLETVITSMEKSKTAAEAVAKAQQGLAGTFGDTASLAESVAQSFRRIKEGSKNMEFFNNNIGGYGKVIQTASERINTVLKKVDGFEIDDDKIVKSFNDALTKSLGASSSAQLASVAKVKQFQQALGALGQVITATKEQQSGLDFTEIAKSINSLDKETKQLVASMTGIDLSAAGNFTKTGIIKAGAKLTDQQKQQLTANLDSVTKAFAENAQPDPKPFKEQLFKAITGNMAPAATVGAKEGLKAALSHPSITTSVVSTLATTFKAVGDVMLKGIGNAMVDTATAFGKYNVDADLGSSMVLRTSMGELQQAAFDNAQAMLANSGGAKEFTTQLKQMTSGELIRKAGYDTAKALQITANTLTTVRAVIGKEITGAVAGKEADDMVNFFRQSAAVGHTTVEEYSNLASQLANNADITESLNKLNVTSRTVALQSIIATRDQAMAMGLSKDKALEFASAMVAARQDSIASRFKTGAMTVSMVSLARSQGFAGMTQAEAIELSTLQSKGATRTAEENKRFEELIPKAGEALAFMRKGQEGSGLAGLSTGAFLEKFEEGLGGSKYGKALLLAAEAPGRAGLAAQAPTPGEADSIMGTAIRATGDLWKTIQTTLDGIFTKGFTSAIFSATGATLLSVASMGLLTMAINANTAIQGGKTLGSLAGSALGGAKRVAGTVAGSVVGGAVLGAGVGYGVSSMLDKEGATKGETVGGGVGGILGGVVGGATVGRVIGGMIGTAFGGPVGTAIGMGVGSVVGHYVGTAIGGMFGDKPAEKVSTTGAPDAGANVKADSYYMGSSSPSQQVTQPILRQTEEQKAKYGAPTDKSSPEYLATIENTDVLRGLLKAQQTQNSLMTDYIDIYKQTTEPSSPFSFMPRPEKEPHNAR